MELSISSLKNRANEISSNEWNNIYIFEYCKERNKIERKKENETRKKYIFRKIPTIQRGMK